MSTKIYTAFRFPLTKLEKVLRRYDQLMKPVVDSYLFDLLGKIPIRDAEGPLSPYFLMNHLWDFLEKEIAKKGICDDPTTGVRVFLFGNYAYVYPFSNNLKIRDFDAYLSVAAVGVPGYEDYAYWNNSDRPEHISARAWNARKKIWNTLLRYGPYSYDYRYASVQFTYNFFRPDKTEFSMTYGDWGWPSCLVFENPSRLPKDVLKYMMSVEEIFFNESPGGAECSASKLRDIELRKK